MKRVLYMLSVMLVVAGCTVSYKFTGASIDYTKVRTISLPHTSGVLWLPCSMRH